MDNPADREKLCRAVLDLVAGRKMPKQKPRGPLESTAHRDRAGSRLLFLAEFLESWIAAQGIPERIEP